MMNPAQRKPTGKKYLAGSVLTIDTAKPAPLLTISVCPNLDFAESERHLKLETALDFIRRTKKPGVLPSLPRCQHGVYAPDGDARCSVCNPILVRGTVRPMKDIHGAETSQRVIIPDKVKMPFEVEIKKALAHAKRILYGYGEEGKKDFADLEQIVDFEIWKATEHYGDKMSSPLAFTIAENQANRLLADLANEPMKVSIDKPDEDGNTMAETLDTPGTQSSLSDHVHNNEVDWAIIPGIPELVATWHGTKKAVAIYLLEHPGAPVGDIPVPKGTASRLRRLILEEFRRIALAAAEDQAA